MKAAGIEKLLALIYRYTQLMWHCILDYLNPPLDFKITTVGIFIIGWLVSSLILQKTVLTPKFDALCLSEP